MDSKCRGSWRPGEPADSLPHRWRSLAGFPFERNISSTRFVVQAVSVAALATILVSFLSPDIQAMQNKMQDAMVNVSAPFGVCETPGVAAQNNLPPGAAASLASLPAQVANAAKAKIIAGLNLACDQTMQGFEAAYRLTFYASIGALILAAFLPGWPGKWSGRGAPETPMPGGH